MRLVVCLFSTRSRALEWLLVNEGSRNCEKNRVMKTVTQITPKVSASFSEGFILFLLVAINHPARRAIFACALALCLSGFAIAQPQQWTGNGHYYEVINVGT